CERNDRRGIGYGIVEEVQNVIGHAERNVADTGARTAVVGDHVRDDYHVLDHVPAFEAHAADHEHQERPQGNDLWNQATERDQEQKQRHEVGYIERQMQPLLRAVEPDQVTEEAKSLIVGHAEEIDLRQLNDVLEDVDALDADDGDEERVGSGPVK